MCYSSPLRRLNPSRLTFGPSLCLAGPSSGGLVSDHQPKRWPHCVVISRQIPAPVGEDQGAHHPGGGAGDGEVADRADTDDFTAHGFSVFYWPSLFLSWQEREAEFEESLAKGDAPVVSAHFSTSCHHQHLFTLHQTLTCILICSALKDKQQFTCLF